MGSISSTINSINTSLLSEISAFESAQTSSGTTSPAASAVGSDSVNISESAQLFQELQQLQTTNPTEFKQVLTDAATQFNAAAAQQADPAAASILSSIAGQFQNAASTGNLSALQPPAANEASGATSGAHRGHHHHHSESSSASTDSATAATPASAATSATTSPTTSLQSLIASLLSSAGPSSATSPATQGSTEIQQALASLFS